MRRALIAVVVAAAAAAPTATAHVTVQPARLAPGAEAAVTLEVPNETGTTVDAVDVNLRALQIEAVEAKPGWRAVRRGPVVVWRGGPIRPGEFATFAVKGTPRAVGRIVFPVRLLRGGRLVERLPAAVDVAAARTETPAVAKIALGVAIGAAAVAVGAFFFALALWLRGETTLQES